MPKLLAAQRRGRRVKALEDRPAIPLHLVAAYRCVADLQGDGSINGVIPFASFALWAAALDIKGGALFFLWDQVQVVQDCFKGD